MFYHNVLIQTGFKTFVVVVKHLQINSSTSEVLAVKELFEASCFFPPFLGGPWENAGYQKRIAI
jgi:hypothetical protein